MRRLRGVDRRVAVVAAVVVGYLLDELARRRPVRRQDAPGLLVVQIDGLGIRALREAIAAEYAPYLGGLIERGEMELEPWLAMVPPTTPASQAGILHGRSAN